jgi:Fe2+ or Zn2+ uptake regulation protein
MNVFDLISGSKLPVDANSLIEKLKVNKTTVYRQIDKLINENKITEVELGDGKKRYELKSLDHHHHLVCKKCGKLEDIELNENDLLKEVAKRTNFVVDSHSLEFFGHCYNCKSK